MRLLMAKNVLIRGRFAIFEESYKECVCKLNPTYAMNKMIRGVLLFVDISDKALDIAEH